LGLIGTTGTGSGAIIIDMANGFRGTVANFTSPRIVSSLREP